MAGHINELKWRSRIAPANHRQDFDVEQIG